MLDEKIFNYDEKLIEKIKTKKWVSFGAGRYFHDFVKKYCVEKHVLPLPEYVCDNNSSIWGENVYGVPIKSPKSLDSEKNSECIIVASAVSPHSILYDLHIGLQKHYFETIPLSQIESYLYFKEHGEDVKKVYNLLSDQQSKDAYKGVWQAMLSGNILFPMLYTPNPYWDNDIIGALQPTDVVMYAGAYDGKHLDRALKSNPLAQIHGFEPNKAVFGNLKKKYENNDNVFLYPAGLGDKNETLYMDNSVELGSMIVDMADLPHKNGNIFSIDVTTIDSIFNNGINLIALDIEGSEPKALGGGRK